MKKMIDSVYSFTVKILTAVTNGFAAVSQKLLGVKSELDDIRATLQEQGKQIAKILAAVTPGPTALVTLSIVQDGKILEGVTHVQLKDTEQVDFTLAPVDAKGQPSSIDPSKTVIAADNPAVASVKLNPDGISGTIVAGAVGSTQITGSVTDANNPADTVPITPLTVAVVAGDTATVAMNTGTPVPQAAPSGGPTA